MQTYRARLALILGQKQRQRPARHWERPAASAASLARRRTIRAAVASLDEYQRRDTRVMVALNVALCVVAGVLAFA